MSEYANCPQIPELKDAIYALVEQTEAQPMPAMPSPFPCEGEPAGYDACIQNCKIAYDKAWSKAKQIGVDKATATAEQYTRDLGELQDAYQEATPDDQRTVCRDVKAMGIRFENDRVALFQSMVRAMDDAKVEFNENTKICCGQSVPEPKDETKPTE